MYRRVMIICVAALLFPQVVGCWPEPPFVPGYDEGYDTGYPVGKQDGTHGYAYRSSYDGGPAYSEEFLSGWTDGYGAGHRDGTAEAEATVAAEAEKVSEPPPPPTIVGEWGPKRLYFSRQTDVDRLDYTVDYEMKVAEDGRFVVNMAMTVLGRPEYGDPESVTYTGHYETDTLPDPDYLTLYIEEVSYLGPVESFSEDDDVRLPFIYEIGEDGLRLGAAWPFWDVYAESATPARPTSFHTTSDLYEMTLPRKEQ